MQEFIFTTSFDTETKGNDLFLDGFISTTEKDLVDDVITVKCLESMKSQILDRNIKLDLEHEAFRGADNEEKEINKTIIPVGRLTDATIENNKLRIQAKINPYHNRYDETKGSIQGQYLDAFSIAYIPTKVSHEVKNGEQIRLLDDVILLNVALTGNPVNTGAQIRDIMIKSMDSLKNFPRRTDEGVPTSTEEQESDEDEDEDEKKRIKRGKIIEDYKADEANKDLLEVKNSYSHSEIKTKKEDNKMSKETQIKEEVVEEVVDSVEELADAAEPEDSPAEASDDSEALSEEVKALKEEVAKLVALNLKTQSKAISEQAPEVKDETKSVEPLDVIR